MHDRAMVAPRVLVATGLACAGIAAFMAWSLVHSRVAPAGRGFDFSPTVSDHARAVLPEIYSPARKGALALPDVAELEIANRKRLALVDGPVEYRAAPDIAIRRRRIGGVPVLDIQPPSIAARHKIIVFIHGGAFVLGSAHNSLPPTVALAEAAGLRTISIDYTTAPFARWREITGEVLSVVAALRQEGFVPADIALVGESAGGNLAAVTALKMREALGAGPASVVVWSPWADLTDTGDTRTTLAAAEVLLTSQRILRPAAALYADAADLRHPHVSPVHADFSGGYPPTLIQAGTREMLLSDAVRLHRAIERDGGVPVLDLTEGMPHVFQAHVNLPEAKAAIARSARFVRKAFDLPGPR